MPDRPTSHPALSLLARIYWTFFGNAALVLTLFWIASRSRGELSAGDAAYGALALGIVVVRFLDVRFMNGETADGERRATLADWSRHALVVVGGAGGAWLAMRAFTGWF